MAGYNNGDRFYMEDGSVLPVVATIAITEEGAPVTPLDGALIGATNETAAASDTATSALNGRLQRIAQRLTSLIALLPTSLGSKAAASSLAVTASTEDIARAGIITETAPANDTASSGFNGRLQRIAQNITSLIAKFVAPTVGTMTSVADSASSVTLLAANAARKGAAFFNDSTVLLYLAASTTAASSTAHTVQVPPGGYWELPPIAGGVYTGDVKGIWASDASGSCRVTEWT